jgi:hypothetical protein
MLKIAYWPGSMQTPLTAQALKRGSAATTRGAQ